MMHKQTSSADTNPRPLTLERVYLHFTILSAEKCSKTTFFRSRLCKYSDYQLKQEHGGNNLQERFFLEPLDQSLPYRLHFVDDVSASNAL